MTAKTMDFKTRVAIEVLDSLAIDDEDACDRRPHTEWLESAGQRQMKVTTLGLRNSGDTAGSKDNVVGYGARMFEATQASKAPA